MVLWISFESRMKYLYYELSNSNEQLRFCGNENAWLSPVKLLHLGNLSFISNNNIRKLISLEELDHHSTFRFLWVTS